MGLTARNSVFRAMLLNKSRSRAGTTLQSTIKVLFLLK